MFLPIQAPRPSLPLPIQIPAGLYGVDSVTGRWSLVRSSVVGSIPPAMPGLGDLWFDNANGEMMVWNGAAWSYVSGGGNLSVGVMSVAAGDGLVGTPNPITTSGSIALQNPLDAWTFNNPTFTGDVSFPDGSIDQDALDLDLDQLLTGYLQKSGGQMTGPLLLNADATQPLQATTLQQVNDILSNAIGGIGVGVTSITAGFGLIGTPSGTITSTGTIALDPSALPATGVTEVQTGTGLSGGPIVDTGMVSLDVAGATTALGGPFVKLAGDTMTGALVINGPAFVAPDYPLALTVSGFSQFTGNLNLNGNLICSAGGQFANNVSNMGGYFHSVNDSVCFIISPYTDPSLTGNNTLPLIEGGAWATNYWQWTILMVGDTFKLTRYAGTGNPASGVFPGYLGDPLKIDRVTGDTTLLSDKAQFVTGPVDAAWSLGMHFTPLDVSGGYNEYAVVTDVRASMIRQADWYGCGFIGLYVQGDASSPTTALTPGQTLDAWDLWDACGMYMQTWYSSPATFFLGAFVNTGCMLQVTPPPITENPAALVVANQNSAVEFLVLDQGQFLIDGVTPNPNYLTMIQSGEGYSGFNLFTWASYDQNNPPTDGQGPLATNQVPPMSANLGAYGESQTIMQMNAWQHNAAWVRNNNNPAYGPPNYVRYFLGRFPRGSPAPPLIQLTASLGLNGDDLVGNYAVIELAGTVLLRPMDQSQRPTAPTAGMVYYDAEANHPFYFNGSTWVQI